MAPVNTVTIAEMFVGIICASTPAAAKCYHHHFHSLKSRLSTIYTSITNRQKGEMRSQPVTASDSDLWVEKEDVRDSGDSVESWDGSQDGAAQADVEKGGR